MLSRLQKEIVRKIAPFREKEILVQYINDSGGMGLREGTLSSFFEESTKYLCISVQERGGLYPSILVGATHSDSQLARIVSEEQGIIFEDENLLPKWEASYLGFVSTFPYFTGKEMAKKLFAKYGLDLPEE